MKQRKIFYSLVLSLFLLLSLNACGVRDNAEKPSEQQSLKPSIDSESSDGNVAKGSGKVLIAYFAVAENDEVDAVSSASEVTIKGEEKGRIRALAEMIRIETGGDLYSIQTSVVYPSDIGVLIDNAAEEQDENARPELTSQIENLDEYDTIFVGYPNWWYDLPMIMYSFFDEYDLSGKTIIPFNSHNGSRFSDTINTLRELEPNATVITEGFTVNERDVVNAGKDVAQWLSEIGY